MATIDELTRPPRQSAQDIADNMVRRNVLGTGAGAQPAPMSAQDIADDVARRSPQPKMRAGQVSNAVPSGGIPGAAPGIQVGNATMDEFKAAQNAGRGGAAAPAAAATPAASRMTAGAIPRSAKIGGAIGAAMEAGDVAGVALNPNSTLSDVSTQAAEGAGKLATAGLGAKAGAALGAMTGPAAPLAVPALSVAGGALGYFGGEKAIEAGRRMLGLDPNSPAERLAAMPAAASSTAAQAAAPINPTDPNETRRNEAANAAASRLAAPTAPQGQPFADWQAGATQKGRDDAADAYRAAWQRQAPGGMRNAGQNATTLYNAEQVTRGTGVTAQRQPNGVMSFSGDGANALPQSFTQGVDLNLANERTARANAIRASIAPLRDQMAFESGATLMQPNGGMGRGGLADTGAQETNEQFRRARTMEAIQNAGRSQAAAIAQLVGQDQATQRSAAELASREREGAANREIETQRIAQTGEFQQGQLANQRGLMENQREETQQRGVKTLLEGQLTQGQIAEQNRLTRLRDRFEAETDPARKEQLGRALLTLSGKEPATDPAQKARYDLVGELAKNYGQLVQPTVSFEQYARPALDLANGAARQAPAFQEGKTYRDANGNLAKYENGRFVPQ